MQKKVLCRVVCVFSLLVSVLIVTQFVSSADANPYNYGIDAGPKMADPAVKPLVVAIVSPQNGSLFGANSVSLNLNVSTKASQIIYRGHTMITDIGINEVFYFADWQNNKTEIYNSNVPTVFEVVAPNSSQLDLEKLTVNITHIPDGKHVVTVVVIGTGYEVSASGSYRFSVTARACIDFSVDTVAPSISVLLPTSSVYNQSEIPLNVIVYEPGSKINYSIDGQTNVTITSNSTLTGLPSGSHNITVFARDLAGNIGTSEVTYFSIDIPQPFPTAPVIAVSVTALAVVACVVLYFAKKTKTKR